MEYIIVGDTERFEGCLVTVCTSQNVVEKTLERMLTNPDDNDRHLIKGHHNLRIEPVEGGWWNDPFLAN